MLENLSIYKQIRLYDLTFFTSLYYFIKFAQKIIKVNFELKNKRIILINICNCTEFKHLKKINQTCPHIFLKITLKDLLTYDLE